MKVGTLETNAGHIIVCLALIAFGAICALLHVPKSEDIILFALGVLGRSMNDKETKSGNERSIEVIERKETP